MDFSRLQVFAPRSLEFLSQPGRVRNNAAADLIRCLPRKPLDAAALFQGKTRHQTRRDGDLVASGEGRNHDCLRITRNFAHRKTYQILQVKGTLAMITLCPHCQTEIEIDATTLAALAGQSHFACPVCQGAVAVPGRKPAQAFAHRGLNRNFLILGALALLVLGSLGFYLASQKSGDTNAINQNISYQEIQNNYFTQIIANGTTTKEELSRIQEIKPFGTLFIGISDEAMSLADAQDLAKRTGATILDYTSNQPIKPAPLSHWLVSSFNLGEKAWVSLHDQYQVIDGMAQLSSVNVEARHNVLVAWQGPNELMMNAARNEPKINGDTKTPKTAAALGVNLIKNPGCDMQPEGAQQIPHWTSLSGDWQQGSKRILPESHDPYEGEHYFYAGKNASGTLAQEIALTPYLNSGSEYYFYFTAYVSSYINQGDSTQIEIEFYDDQRLLFTLPVGLLNSRGLWFRQSKSGHIPPTATKARIKLTSSRVSGGSSNDGYFDSLSFQVEKELPHIPDVAGIDPKRKTYTKTWSDGVRGDFVNYEPGKWKEVIGNTAMFYFQETARNAHLIEISDDSRGCKFILKETTCELWANGRISQSTAGRWLDSLDEATQTASKPSVAIPRDALEYKGHYYKFYPTKKTWEEAKKECEAMGGTLAIADKPDVIYFLNDKVVKDEIWLNGFRQGEQWVWANGVKIDDDYLEMPTELIYEEKNYGILLKHFNPTIYLDADSAKKSYVCSWQKTDFPDAQVESMSPKVEMRISPKAQKYKTNHYVVFSRWSNWYDAKKFCESLGGHLVTIADEGEFDFVVQLTGGNHVFVGATNLTESNKWTWIDGTPVSDQMINDGNIDLPHKEHFLSLTRQFHDHPPHTGFVTAFVCEWEGDEAMPESAANPQVPEDTQKEANAPEESPRHYILTNKAGISIEVEIISVTESHVRVRLIKNNEEYDVKLETLRQEAQDVVATWKSANQNQE